ncbi:MAG: hypothetical protein COW30_12370 [Rhodospirillales bacterium CG15_BIG_FIL_POST_REV_8_21_14_020_66_15]|nr:MAG: hypothetical protein COW30_12370 [Rhodospirillales bacterium CG15_BIG_FIL_POST_REV_8_21_14_020_66_15]
MKLPKSTMPFLLGAGVGAIVLAFLAFGNDWVVYADASKDDVQDAWINAQAAVCAARATEHVKTMASAPDLQGYQSDARTARADLAADFAVALPGQDAPESMVVSACAQMLNKSL